MVEYFPIYQSSISARCVLTGSSIHTFLIFWMTWFTVVQKEAYIPTREGSMHTRRGRLYNLQLTLFSAKAAKYMTVAILLNAHHLTHSSKYTS